MVLDPYREDISYQASIIPLQEAVMSITPQLNNTDTIVIITPHGISLWKHYAVFLNSTAFGRGDIEEPGKWDDFGVQASIDTELSQHLMDKLGFEGITQFA
jgi:aromatic ring-opening dioxygenase LigB subunit